MPDSLLEETRKLLEADPRRLSVLSRDTGLPYFWLRNFKKQLVKNPGILRIELLHRFLTEKG